MATKLFLLDSAVNAIGDFYDTNTTANSSSTTGVVNTTASGTEIQWTRTAGGTVLEWISGRVPSGGFTLSGTVTYNIWAQESNMSANVGVAAKIFKRVPGGTETQVGTTTSYGSPTEISFSSVAEYSWTMTPGTGVAFAENDRLVVRFYIINVGTMGGGYTATCTYNGADAATGDSFVQINENVTFKPEDYPITSTDTLNSWSDTASTSLETGTLNLPVTTSDSLNNYSDVTNIRYNSYLQLSDNAASNLLDAIATFSAHYSELTESFALADALTQESFGFLEFNDSLSITDSLTPEVSYLISLTEDVNNLIDGILIELVGNELTKNLNDNLNNWSDTLDTFSSIYLELDDSIALSDELVAYFNTYLELSSDLNSWLDTYELSNVPVIDLIEDLNNFSDSLSVSLGSTGSSGSSLVTPYTRAGNLAYIRRYVNDVKR